LANFLNMNENKKERKSNVDNTKELQLLSFCTGYGGIERGLELIGVPIRTIAHVEIEAFAIANLVAKMESEQMVPAPVWTNVKTLSLEVFRDRVDILTGGYPCQPFSFAGKQKGKEDPRHLWPYILRAIGVIRPRIVFFENVEGHINNGLQEVLGDLEKRGYRTTWGIFSASEVGAPHQRKRVFIMGYFESGCDRQYTTKQKRGDTIRATSKGSTDKKLGNPNSEGPQRFSESCRFKKKFPKPSCESQSDWEEPRTVESGMGRTANGVASRVDELRLLGNGVVPQTAALAWRILSERLKDGK